MDAAVHDAMIEGAVEATYRGMFCDSRGFRGEGCHRIDFTELGWLGVCSWCG